MPPLPNDVMLASIVEIFKIEVTKIESIFASCVNHDFVFGYRFEYRPTEDGCLISLWDSWNRFLRKLIVTSASGHARGSQELYLPQKTRTEDEVIADLNQNKKEPGRNFGIDRGEPKWSTKDCLVSIIDFLELPNGEQIAGAVGSSEISIFSSTVRNPLPEIKYCRNFVAHKGGNTLSLIDGQYGNSPLISISAHMRDLRHGGIETFSEWSECLVAIATNAAK